MDQSEIVVSFTLSVDEARRERDDLQKKAGTTKTAIRFQWGVAVFWLSCGILNLVTDHAKWLGWFYVLGGCMYAWQASRQRVLIVNVPAGVETSIRFSRAGIVFERPAQQTLAWSAVEGVDRLDDALVVRFLASAIEAPLEQRVVIPKRAQNGGGDALWSLFEQMLLGPLRRVSAQLSVDETGGLRRNDGRTIENRRSRDAVVRERLARIRRRRVDA